MLISLDFKWQMGWEDPLERGKAYPLEYSGLENSMDDSP